MGIDARSSSTVIASNAAGELSMPPEVASTIRDILSYTHELRDWVSDIWIDKPGEEIPLSRHGLTH